MSDVVALAHSWLTSKDLSVLLTAIDAPSPSSSQGLADLADWSSQNFDLRRGSERQAVDARRFPVAFIIPILKAAGPLGLLHTEPPQLDAYDLTVVLGGTTTAHQLRAGFVNDMVKRGTDPGTIVGLATERPLSPQEQTDGERSELAHLRSVLLSMFGTRRVSSGRPRTSYFIEAAPIQLKILSVPQRVNYSRATTADAVQFLTTRIAPAERSNILVVTNAIYTPYQFFTAAPLLLTSGAGVVEMVGTSTSVEGPPYLRAQRLAQELHATFLTLRERSSDYLR